jgi:dGTPase
MAKKLSNNERMGGRPLRVDPDKTRPGRRTPGQHDSDRILISSAFQRLAGITQVVPAGTGNAAHSRLTHSIKVGRVARRLSERVLDEHSKLKDRIDVDSVEAAGFAHDLGHPPFGHVAEKKLNELVKPDGGGFEGNAQSFRIATRLGQRYPDLEGLNLTRGTLNAMLKYPWPRVSSHEKKAEKKRWEKWGAYKEDEDAFKFAREMHKEGDQEPCLGARIMDWADDLTYAVHDLEDFFRAGAVPLDRLCSSDEELDSFLESIDREARPGGRLADKNADAIKEAATNLFGQLLDFRQSYNGTTQDRQVLRVRTNFLIGAFMRAFKVDAQGEVKIRAREKHEVEALKQLTWHYVINRPNLSSVQQGQRKVIENLFEVYTDAATGDDRMHLLPPLEQEMVLADVPPRRIAADFISRLTEDRAMELHRRVTGQAAWILPTAEH